MKCIEKLKALAASVGATVDEHDRFIVVDAPAGYVWTSDNVASITEQCANSSQSYMVNACRELERQMREGLTKCDAEQSAEIEYERDEPWAAPADAPETLMVG